VGVAQNVQKQDPRRYTTTHAKAGRERKILLDYLRNPRAPEKYSSAKA
jgi:DNA primase